MSEPTVARNAESRRLSHLNADGHAQMVDVSGKDVTVRVATAAGVVLLSSECVRVIRDGSVPKGDALAVARIAGIQGAKKTPDLIPLCHPLPVTAVEVGLEVVERGVEIAATVRTTGRTGVEMEALTAVAVAGLAMIDMIKAVDKQAVLSEVRVLAKSGGRSGDWVRETVEPREASADDGE